MRYEQFARTWKLIPVSKKLWKKDVNLINFLKCLLKAIDNCEDRKCILETAMRDFGEMTGDTLLKKSLDLSREDLAEIFLLMQGIQTRKDGNKIIAETCFIENLLQIQNSYLCSKFFEGFSSRIRVKIECSCNFSQQQHK